MKKILVGIFAHPDDETMPSATLMKEAEAATDVYLICATRGDKGLNLDNHQDLGAVRIKEWREAAALIGATDGYSLDYKDGTLCNNLYHEVASTVETIIHKVCKRYDQAVELSLMTFDINGLTGHLDHIAISYITTFLFYRLKAKAPPHTTVKELAYFCWSEKQMPQPNHNYFIFMPVGQPASYITRQVDVSSLIDRKYAVMRAHYTQRTDVQQFIDYGHDFHAVDNFRVISS